MVFQQMPFFVLVYRSNLLHFCIINNETTAAQRNRRGLLILDFETFHEIIYGKPARCKRAPRFFLPKNCLLKKAVSSEKHAVPICLTQQWNTCREKGFTENRPYAGDRKYKCNCSNQPKNKEIVNGAVLLGSGMKTRSAKCQKAAETQIRSLFMRLYRDTAAQRSAAVFCRFGQMGNMQRATGK